MTNSLGCCGAGRLYSFSRGSVLPRTLVRLVLEMPLRLCGFSVLHQAYAGYHMFLETCGSWSRAPWLKYVVRHYLMCSRDTGNIDPCSRWLSWYSLELTDVLRQ